MEKPGVTVEKPEPAKKEEATVEKSKLTPDEERAKQEAHLKKAREEQDKIPPDHPRFKEMVWKVKKMEQERAEWEKDQEVLRKHNQEMAERLERLERGKEEIEDPEPDILTDPEGYKNWVKARELKNQSKRSKEIETLRLQNQIDVLVTMHGDDYDKMRKIAERDMELDAALKKKIWSSPNPPLEAYKYGKGKMDELTKSEEEEKKRLTNQDKTEVLTPSGDEDGDPKEPTLSDDEKRVARRLFPEIEPEKAYKKYLAQKE